MSDGCVTLALFEKPYLMRIEKIATVTISN